MMERSRNRIIVTLTAVLVIAAGGAYQWWEKASVPIKAEVIEPKVSLHSSQPVPVSTMMFYISGAVQKPGLYEGQPGMRVLDAINKAGGLTPEADTGKINLAQSVKDGHHIAVPKLTVSAETNREKKTADVPTAEGKKININTAEKNELDQLPGIGPATAEKIIEYRQSKGPFRDIAEIQLVPGIGEAKFKQLAPKITI